MRQLMLLTLAAALTLPSLPNAADWSPVKKGARRGSVRARPPAAVYTPSARKALSPAQPRGAPARPPPRATSGRRVFVLGVDPIPFWAGWSWGWGYYPLWPRPYHEDPSYLRDDTRRLGARLEAYGAGAESSAAGTLAISMEGPIAGFNADVTGLALSDPAGATTTAALTLASARATWSIASEASYRLRLEVGGTMVSVPSTGIYAGTTYANTIAFGPQIGLSGHVGLVGPFGLEGHARVTPYPVPVVDAKAAFVVRGGPLAVSAGWRSVDVNGDGVDAPEAHFEGPELGIQLAF